MDLYGDLDDMKILYCVCKECSEGRIYLCICNDDKNKVRSRNSSLSDKQYKSKNSFDRNKEKKFKNKEEEIKEIIIDEGFKAPDTLPKVNVGPNQGSLSNCCHDAYEKLHRLEDVLNNLRQDVHRICPPELYDEHNSERKRSKSRKKNYESTDSHSDDSLYRRFRKIITRDASDNEKSKKKKKKDKKKETDKSEICRSWCKNPLVRYDINYDRTLNFHWPFKSEPCPSNPVNIEEFVKYRKFIQISYDDLYTHELEIVPGIGPTYGSRLKHLIENVHQLIETADYMTKSNFKALLKCYANVNCYWSELIYLSCVAYSRIHNLSDRKRSNIKREDYFSPSNFGLSASKIVSE